MESAHRSRAGVIAVISIIIISSLGITYLMVPEQPISMGGEMYTAAPLAGASLIVPNSQGKGISSDVSISNGRGAFLMEIDPNSYWADDLENVVVRSEGGSVDGAPFRGTLKTAVPDLAEEDYLFLNPMTTLVATYMEEHPGLTKGEAKILVKDYLELPGGFSMESMQ